MHCFMPKYGLFTTEYSKTEVNEDAGVFCDVMTNIFLFITQKCSNLSEDIQQQCWRGVIVTCRGYI
jgi:hypothetical protein